MDGRIASLVTASRYSFGYTRPKLPEPKLPDKTNPAVQDRLYHRVGYVPAASELRKTWDDVDIMPCHKQTYIQRRREARDREEAVAKQVKKKKKLKPGMKNQTSSAQNAPKGKKNNLQLSDLSRREKESNGTQTNRSSLLNAVEFSSDHDSVVDSECYLAQQAKVGQEEGGMPNLCDDRSGSTSPLSPRVTSWRPKFGLAKKLSKAYKQVSASGNTKRPKTPKKTKIPPKICGKKSEKPADTSAKVKERKKPKLENKKYMDHQIDMADVQITLHDKYIKSAPNKEAEAISNRPVSYCSSLGDTREEVKASSSQTSIPLSMIPCRIPHVLRSQQHLLGYMESEQCSSSAGVPKITKMKMNPLDQNSVPIPDFPPKRRARTSVKVIPPTKTVTIRIKSSRERYVAKAKDGINKVIKKDLSIKNNKTGGVVSIHKGINKYSGSYGAKQQPSPQGSSRPRNKVPATKHQVLQPLKNPPSSRPHMTTMKVTKTKKEKCWQYSQNTTTVFIPRPAWAQKKLVNCPAALDQMQSNPSASNGGKAVPTIPAPKGQNSSPPSKPSKVLSPQTANKLKLAKKQCTEPVSFPVTKGNDGDDIRSSFGASQVPVSSENHTCDSNAKLSKQPVFNSAKLTKHESESRDVQPDPAEKSTVNSVPARRRNIAGSRIPRWMPGRFTAQSQNNKPNLKMDLTENSDGKTLSAIGKSSQNVQGNPGIDSTENSDGKTLPAIGKSSQNVRGNSAKNETKPSKKERGQPVPRKPWRITGTYVEPTPAPIAFFDGGQLKRKETKKQSQKIKNDLSQPHPIETKSAEIQVKENGQDLAPEPGETVVSLPNAFQFLANKHEGPLPCILPSVEEAGMIPIVVYMNVDVIDQLNKEIDNQLGDLRGLENVQESCHSLAERLRLVSQKVTAKIDSLKSNPRKM